MIRYWYQNCPSCQQGRLFVEVNDLSKEMFLECEECARAWKTPERVLATENAFLATDIESRFASGDEIARGGWLEYKFHEATENP